MTDAPRSGVTTQADLAATTTEATISVSDLGNGTTVAREVFSARDAFCAGLSSTLADSWTAETVSEVFDAPLPHEECIEEGLAEALGVPGDMALHDAYANGCAVAIMATLPPELSLDAETDYEIAFGVCGAAFDEREWDPDDYRITRDGVCYIGYGAEAGVLGCRNTAGDYITTTTFAYTASGGMADLLDFAATGPEVLRLTIDPALAGDVAQDWCFTGVEYGTGDFAVWLHDLGADRAGHYGYPDTAYADVARFLPLLADRTISSLCPEIADQFQSDIEAAQLGQALNSPGPDEFGIATFYWEGTQFDVFADIYWEQGREHWMQVGYAICEDLDEGAAPDDLFLAAEAWVDAGAPFQADLLDEPSRQLHNEAIAGLCPRHSRYEWSIVETGTPPWGPADR